MMEIHNYQKMLNYIAIVGIVVSFFCAQFLKDTTNILDNLVIKLPFEEINILENTVVKEHFTVFAIAIIWGFLSRSLIIHDKISDMFKIRERFDCKYILVPFAEKLNINLNDDKKKKMFENRKLLMGKIFYKYADSTKSENVISRHLISKALGNWANYWVLIESYIPITAVLVILIAKGEAKFMYIVSIIVIILIMIVLNFYFYSKSKSIVLAEIEAILDLNDSNRITIKEEIENAL